MSPQPGILADVPAVSRYLSFRLTPGADPRPALEALAKRKLGDEVVGLGQETIARLGETVDGLHELPALSGPGAQSPSTPRALWLWLRGDDPGELLHRGRELSALLSPAFEVADALAAFRHGKGLDLSGYVDGTENPTGDDAKAAACVADRGAGFDGGSFVAVQRWEHDLGRWDAIPAKEQDHVIGRSRETDEELDDAPASAHVKRTEQEAFEPHAHVLRRSMPWTEGAACGLQFVAFGKSLRAFEVQLRRMVGLDDGITDALFRFTRPVTGCAFWCPPVKKGKLDLSAVGI